MTTKVVIPAYDPQGSLDNPTRTLAPAVKFLPVTADTNLGCCRWIYIGGNGGAVSYVAIDGDTVNSFPMSAGQVLYMEFQQINSSGTTATNIWYST